MECVYDKPLIAGRELSPLLVNACRRLCSLLVNADSNKSPQPIDDDIATNKDGLVSKESFSKLFDMDASIPRINGYVSTNVGLYKTEDKKEQARR